MTEMSWTQASQMKYQDSYQDRETENVTWLRRHLKDIADMQNLAIDRTEQSPIAGGKALSISQKPSTSE